MRRWRAAGNVDVDRHDTVDAAEGRVGALAEDASAAAARADGHHDAWLRRRLVSSAQRDLHVAGHRTGHQQHVGVPRTRDQVNAEALEIVQRDSSWRRSPARSHCSCRRRLAERAASGPAVRECASRRRAAAPPGRAPAARPPGEACSAPVAGSTSNDADCCSCSRRVSGHLAVASRRSPPAPDRPTRIRGTGCRRRTTARACAGPARARSTGWRRSGTTRAHSSHIVHRVKSITGKPNGGRPSNGAASVRIPVCQAPGDEC